MQNVHLVIMVITALMFALPHTMVLGVFRNVTVHVQHVIIFMAAFQHVELKVCSLRQINFDMYNSYLTYRMLKMLLFDEHRITLSDDKYHLIPSIG